MKTYQAPWGKALIVISSTLALLAVANVIGLRLLLVNIPKGVGILAHWAVPVIVLGCLPFMIRGYAITEEFVAKLKH